MPSFPPEPLLTKAMTRISKQVGKGRGNTKMSAGREKRAVGWGGVKFGLYNCRIDEVMDVDNL